MVALNVERSRFAFVGVERAARNALNLFAADSGDAIANHCHGPPDQGDIEHVIVTLPGSVFFGSQPAIDRAHQAIRRSLRTFAPFNLDFVAAAQIEAAVGVVRTTDFEVNLKVSELAGGHQIRAMVLVDQQAVFHNPLTLARVAHRFPAREVLAIEERFRRCPGLRCRALEFRSPGSNQRNHLVAALLHAGQFAINRIQIPGSGRPFGIRRCDGERQVIARYFGVLHLFHVSAGRLEPDLERAALFRNANPVGLQGAGAWQVEIPTAN